MGKETTKEISKRSEANTSVSSAMLESYRKALYAARDFFETASKNMNEYDVDTQVKVTKAILDAGEKLGKNIESLDKLEDKVKREERETISRRGSSETSQFEE